MVHQLYENEQYKDIFTELSKLTVKGQTADVYIPLIPDDWDSIPSPKVNWYGAAPNGCGSDEIPEVWSFENNLVESPKICEC